MFLITTHSLAWPHPCGTGCGYARLDMEEKFVTNFMFFSAYKKKKTNYSQELIVVFLSTPRRVVSSTHVRAIRVSAFLQQHMALPVRFLLVDGVISFLRLLMSLPFSCEPSTHLLSPDWTAVCTDTKSVDGSKLIRSFLSIYFRETSFNKGVREEVSAVFPFEAVTTLTRLRI